MDAMLPHKPRARALRNALKHNHERASDKKCPRLRRLHTHFSNKQTFRRSEAIRRMLDSTWEQLFASLGQAQALSLSLSLSLSPSSLSRVLSLSLTLFDCLFSLIHTPSRRNKHSEAAEAISQNSKLLKTICIQVACDESDLSLLFKKPRKNNTTLLLLSHCQHRSVSSIQPTPRGGEQLVSRGLKLQD